MISSYAARTSPLAQPKRATPASVWADCQPSRFSDSSRRLSASRPRPEDARASRVPHTTRQSLVCSRSRRERCAALRMTSERCLGLVTQDPGQSSSADVGPAIRDIDQSLIRSRVSRGIEQILAFFSVVTCFCPAARSPKNAHSCRCRACGDLLALTPAPALASPTCPFGLIAHLLHDLVKCSAREPVRRGFASHRSLSICEPHVRAR